MNIIVAFILVTTSGQGYNGTNITAVSPIVFPTSEDCMRVARHSAGGVTCVKTRILVPR